MTSRIEAVIEHLTYTKGVVGVVVCTTDGVAIRDSFQQLDRSTALTYTEMASSLVRTAITLFAPDGKSSTEDSLELMRVRSRVNEIVITRQDEFIVVVVQEPGE